MERSQNLVFVILAALGTTIGCGKSRSEPRAKPPAGGGGSMIASITCGRKYLDETTNLASFSGAACASVTLAGSEWVRKLAISSAGDVVISAANFDWYPFLFILRDTGAGVDPANCVTANFYAVRFAAAAGESFYVVVDQDGGAGGDLTFDLQVNCAAPSTESACADGFDGDGDWSTDCADPDCGTDPACDVGRCEAWEGLACGATLVPGATDAFGSTSSVVGYTCPSARVPDSAEHAYSFMSDTTQEVVFTLTDFGGYPMLFVLEDDGTGCNPNNCVAHNYYSVSFTAQAGKPYYLVVDGWGGTPYPYRASVVCSPPAAESGLCLDDVDNDGDAAIDCADDDCAADSACTLSRTCAPVETIGCGTTRIRGDTAGARTTNAVPNYACYPDLPLGGAEEAFELGPMTRSGRVLVTLGDYSSYPVVSVLEEQGSGCDPAACVAENYYGVEFTAQKGKTYYVAVEADISYAPTVSYELSVICEPPATEAGACGDRVDNDGDVATDCGDPDCAAECSSAGLCSPVQVIDCGTTLQPGSTTAAEATTGSDAYGCYPDLTMTGAEVAYTFVASHTGRVNFTLSEESYYAGIAVLKDDGAGCDPAACAAFQYYSVVAYVEAGRTYHVVVDRPDPGTVDYRLSVVCNPPLHEDPASTCSDNVDNDADFYIDCYDPDCGC